MKKLILTAAVAVAVVASGCKGGSKADGESLAAQQDSLALALGELFASQYAYQVNYMPDSLRYDKAEFMKGLKTALAADTTKAGESYLAGLQMGMNWLQQIQYVEKEAKASIDKRLVLNAFKDAIAPDSITVKQEEAYNKTMKYLAKVKEIALENDAVAMANKKKSEDYLASLKKQEGVRTLSNGLVYKVVEEGDGAKVNASDMVYAIYSMSSLAGEQLMSSNGEAQQIPASAFGNINPMMAEGITAMRQHGHFVFYVNIGANVPQGSQLKPFDILVFDVQLADAPAKDETTSPKAKN